MSDRLDTRVIQVTNVAPTCTNEQLRILFGYLGRLKELKVYPPENTEGTVARVAYIEFEDSSTAGVALHLSSTVFIDRALMIVPVMDGKIPDETTALQLTPQAVAGMLPGQPTWPANVVSQVTGTGANQIITTYDPRMTSLGLPQYPPLPITTDASKIEEIRRTVYVSDLDPKVTAEMLLGFFSQVGEIKYIRLAGDEHAGARAAYIEFTDQRCVAQALTYNNVVFMGRPISVQHAKTSIIKPALKTEASQREIDEAMKKVKEASKLISAAASEAKKTSSRSPSRKRSRSKSKRRSRSPSRSRRSRSRSKGRHRRSRSRTNRRSRSRHRSPRRSRTPIRRRRSRSRGRVVPSASIVVRRSRSRDRRRSRTRSPVRRRHSRTRSKSRRRSRTPPRSYSKRSPLRRSRSRSKRRSRSRDRKEKIKEKKKSISLSPPRLERNGSIPPKTDDDDKGESPRKIEISPKTSRTEGDDARSALAGGEGDKANSKKRSPSPVKPRRRSPTPRKRSRSRSPNSRRKRRRRTRTPSPRKRSRSRSISRHRVKRERSKRSRSRDRKHDSKKKTVKEKEEKKKDSSSLKVKRDYDEEEKGFASGSDRIREDSEPRSSGSPPPLEPEDKDSDHQPVDMEMSD